MSQRSKIILAGLMGVLASIFVGVGEFLLHYDALARYGDGYTFLSGVTQERATTGHFIAVVSVPFYIVGAWHLGEMLRPSNAKLARIAFLVLSYGFVIGAVWIGSRSSATTFVALSDQIGTGALIQLYELRYESLLMIVRLAVLIFSGLFIWLILTRKTYYPVWVTFLNPICLIFLSFLVFILAPSIGRFLMPIALNVAFFILFVVSTYIAAFSTHLTNDE